MSDKIKLSYTLNDRGELIIVDQDGREIEGVIALSVGRSVDELSTATLTVYVHDKNGEFEHS